MSPIGLSREIEQHPDSVSATEHHIKASTLRLIQNFLQKLYYRKLLIVAKIEESTTASEVVKSLTDLHAIRWLAQAWSQVSSDAIKKCFRKQLSSIKASGSPQGSTY